MKFETYIPAQQLRPYIKYFAVSENKLESEYKVSPSSGLVIGFQYKGQLATIKGNASHKLASAGITGLSDSYRIFKNSSNIGTILLYFTQTGFIHFASYPAHELFNLSLYLEHVFDKGSIHELEENLAFGSTDKERIKIVEGFLLSQIKHIQTDKLIVEAVKLIYQSKGTIRMKELSEKLFISQSPFEKRFRKVVGTSAKKFASILRFNCVLDHLNSTKSFTDICYENHFFDQSHFIKDFKGFTGETPENFKRFF